MKLMLYLVLVIAFSVDAAARTKNFGELCADNVWKSFSHPCQSGLVCQKDPASDHYYSRCGATDVSQLECPDNLVLKIEGIDVWIKWNKKGKSGQYFYFSESDLTKKTGPYWGGAQGTKFDVAQSGSSNWDGKIIVWRDDVGRAYGRRVSGPSEGQWKVGDTIKFVC